LVGLSGYDKLKTQN